ncbi:UDP-N-acetylmuramate--L-alanine ligase [Mariniphaga anaerophila]|uniref:UDP-N-acetylmuramate--L-alanine ligase n=1 Tax=Mariniphaga anaerophila TaxID=1484053 RepID=A0A1M5A9J2_9BACT|nr:UDP-N-acetylmuramate--L-alanine ligase [Mariniphaga anaerophila]SHF26939.1 UDP-N-acetylmuramate--L-alanine ligase [Mariniphaga anaerophila]
MSDLQKIKNVYFLGIGGIGMSALARYFKYTGRNVAGYDRTQTALTDALQAEGIDVHFEDNIRHIPSNWNPVETLAIYTPALPDDNKELSWFMEKPTWLIKRAKALGMVCNERNCVAVSGTHGKTTVSTMTATILRKSKAGCGAFLGGVSKNFRNNLLLPPENSPWIVAEADEFDRSFLNLFPQLALVTSVDADHLDIYGDKAKIEESFEKFISQIKPGGKLVVKKGVELDTSKTQAEVFSYSLSENADFNAVNLHLSSEGGHYCFDLKTPDGIITHCKLNYPGLVNVENAVGASALAFLAGASADDIKSGLEEYQGVLRRFDVKFKSETQIYIDDYAHHPAELKAVIGSVKALYPNRKVTGIFQPHLYSRTRDFADDFAASLDLLDEAVLVPIYPAREEPIAGVSSELILGKMKNEHKFLVEKSDVPGLLKERETDVVLTMGAGNIDGISEQIIEVLKNKN